MNENKPASGSLPPSTWILFSCLVVGAIAELTRYNTLWGSGSIFTEYAFPLWLNFGSMHIPGLVLGYALLHLLRRGTKQQLSLARYFLVGLFIAALIADYDIKRADLGQSPPWLFLMVDSVTLWLFSFTYWKLPAPDKPCKQWLFIVVLLVPIAIASLSRLTFIVFDDTPVYRIWTSDHWKDKDVEVFWAYIEKPLEDPAAECNRLSQFAPDPYVFLGQAHHPWPKRHRIILLFSHRQAMYNENPTMAAYQYEWWPDGKSECRIKDRDYRAVKNLRGRGPFSYPWPTGME